MMSTFILLRRGEPDLKRFLPGRGGSAASLQYAYPSRSCKSLQFLWLIPCIVPTLVTILKNPLALIATLPMYVPTFFPLLTTALTMSPVLNPNNLMPAFLLVLGKPYLSILHICLLP